MWSSGKRKRSQFGNFHNLELDMSSETKQVFGGSLRKGKAGKGNQQALESVCILDLGGYHFQVWETRTPTLEEVG